MINTDYDAKLVKLPKPVVWENELSEVRVYCRAYVQQLRQALGLRDYRIDVIVQYDPANEQQASMKFNDLHSFAEIRVNYAVIDDIDTLHYCLCHEVVHCMQHEYETAYNAAVNMVSEMGADVLKPLFDKACEAATIRFANYLVKAFEPKYKPIANIEELFI